MVGYLNAHGTSLGLNGQFISLSMSDDEIDAGMHENPSLIVFPAVDFDGPYEDELDDDDILCCELVQLDTTDYLEYDFDEQLEETFWSSLLLGSDYDWDVNCLWTERDIAHWVAMRYEDVIGMNDAFGFKPVNVSVHEKVPVADTITPSFGSTGRGVRNTPPHVADAQYARLVRRFRKRGGGQKQPRGWKKFSPHGRETIRGAYFAVQHYDASHYLSDNAQINLH